MDVQFAIVMFVAVCAVVIIAVTVYQKRKPSSIILMESETYAQNISKQLVHQRSITAVLREGLSALSKCKYKILVIDDNIDTRVTYRIEFKNDDVYAFFFPKDEQEALEWIDTIHFDLLIIDPSISREAGESLIKKEVFSGHKIPCIITSSCLSDSFRKKLLAYKIVILSKPINFMVLRAKIKRIIGGEC